MKKAILPAIALALLTPLSAADAEDTFLHEIKIGVLDHDADNLWSGFRLEDGIDLNLELVLTPHVDVWGGELRPAVGVSLNSEGDTSKLYVDAKWEVNLGQQGYFSLGLGGALHDGELNADKRDRKALGSSVLFHIPIEFGYRFDQHHGMSLYFDHVSNGFLKDNNEGLDTLGFRYGYRL